MTNSTEDQARTQSYEKWRSIPTTLLHRGRVVRYFSMDTPDRKGRFGYGFFKTESRDSLFFRMSLVAGVEVSKLLPEPRLLFVRQHHFHIPLEEPKPGDLVRYIHRTRPCGCPEDHAESWMYERDYLAAERELGMTAG